MHSVMEGKVVKEERGNKGVKDMSSCIPLSVKDGQLSVIRFPDVNTYASHLSGLVEECEQEKDSFISVTVTKDEVSVVCSDEKANAMRTASNNRSPSNVCIEGGWRAIMVQGPLDFSLIGIIRSLSHTLAEAGVSVFVISTFDTDYMLVKQTSLDSAVQALTTAGHKFLASAQNETNDVDVPASKYGDDTSVKVAGFEPFHLERYFAKHEFSAPHLLCSSDIEPLSQSDLLSMADEECKKLWETLSLGYTESEGLPILRQEIAQLYNKSSVECDGMRSVSGDDVLLCVPEEGIYLTCRALLRPGDKVVVPWPCYQSLSEVAEAIGCEVVRWMPDKGTGRFEVETFKSLVDLSTKLVVINFPHNPTGCMLTHEELQEVVDVCAAHDECWLLSDEMYRGLELDPSKRLPAVVTCTASDEKNTKRTGLESDRTVSLAGMSKVYGLAGLRMGWLATRNRILRKRLCQLKDYTTICSSAPSEILSLIGIRNHERLVKRSMGVIREGLAAVGSFMKEHIDLFDWVEPDAGSVSFPSLNSNVKVSATTFCDTTVERCGVMLLPASVYGLTGEGRDRRFRVGFGRRSVPDALHVLREHVRDIL